MSIGADYSKPVLVNGYECWNCSQVDEAKKGIDPADPKAGPYSADGASDPAAAQGSKPGSAVVYGGALAGLASSLQSSPSDNAKAAGQGVRLDISV
jgi:hypothetical protein